MNTEKRVDKEKRVSKSKRKAEREKNLLGGPVSEERWAELLYGPKIDPENTDEKENKYTDENK
nr:hypothetical protein [Desulfobulbaceae bacterium]